ncbi:O-antigen ligase family protein [Chryseobacterium sp. L7]|uniref:O-antigen ligase family protein n=1 Tax=Chryseobacterium endalhagicum TaxID=2797638 RepID=A0ABS1QB66_9FLAO|nr:O-antigen ligase family protein [Chryseobacterium endalhagicum]MBL1219843.1 O-antigen ligase family protein [Chryseobacterium endalhagicum]
MKNEYQIYIRMIVLNMIPYIAVLSISLSKDIMVKLNRWAFNFLLIIIGLSSLYIIFVTHGFERSSGIFASYYISVGHYGLSLVILSVFYYFQPSEKKIKPILGILIGIFTVFISSARSPMLAALVLVLIFLIYFNKLKYWIALACFILIFVIVIYGLKQTSLADFAFVNRMYDAIFNRDGYGRSHYLLMGWDIFKNNILLGGNILFEDGLYPHNMLIEILMGMGIVGFIVFCLYFKDLWKFKIRYVKERIYNLPYILFFIQYFVLVLTSYNIFENMEFWSFAAVAVSIILFCYDEETKSNDSRGNTAGNH